MRASVHAIAEAAWASFQREGPEGQHDEREEEQTTTLFLVLTPQPRIVGKDHVSDLYHPL